ncbi:MAG: N-acetylmuramoyl-L-alanine amidase [Actinobacteria bacterium]|nr:N-acetylmuramoyl-L-alanine amidase [Actinomycetota bacterium]
METIKKGNRGKEVIDIQSRLTALGFKLGREGVDGVFGPATEKAVKEFQKKRKLFVDGIVGEETWRELVDANYTLGDRLLYLKVPFFRGDDVVQIQKWLNVLGFNVGEIDGVFGVNTEKAVRSFQKSTGLHSDGIVGPTTIKALENLKSVVDSNIKSDFPEGVSARESSSSVAGKRIVVDFGHGYPPDPGAVGSAGLKESEMCEDIGLRFGNLIQLSGGEVCYVRNIGDFVELTERVKTANDLKANLFVSFHLNGSADPVVDGTSVYYFKRNKNFSAEGKKLAASVQRRLLEALGSEDRGIQGADFLVLKLTKMAAILIEPFFITNPERERALRKEDFRQKIAVAVFDGVQDYFTGVL